MKIRSLKTRCSLVWLVFLTYILSTTFEAFLKTSYIPICCFSYICNAPKSWFNNKYLKKKKNAERKEKGLNWMENFKIEGTYLKLCYEFRGYIWCMKAVFFRPDYQKFLMCSLIKGLGWAFVSKNTAKPLKHSVELLKHFKKSLRV